MKMIPRCTGFTPNAVPSGTISGTTTTIAEKMSIRQPTTSRNRFSPKRNVSRESMCACVQASRCAGTCALTR